MTACKGRSGQSVRLAAACAGLFSLALAAGAGAHAHGRRPHSGQRSGVARRSYPQPGQAPTFRARRALRNRFNHSIVSFDMEQVWISTILMRL